MTLNLKFCTFFLIFMLRHGLSRKICFKQKQKSRFIVCTVHLVLFEKVPLDMLSSFKSVKGFSLSHYWTCYRIDMQPLDILKYYDFEFDFDWPYKTKVRDDKISFALHTYFEIIKYKVNIRQHCANKKLSKIT